MRPAATPAAAAVVAQVDKGSRAIELQQAFLILGAILLLGLTFYGGTKLNYIRFLIASRNAPTMDAERPRSIPGRRRARPGETGAAR